MTLMELKGILVVLLPILGATGTGAKLYGDKYIWVASDTYYSTELQKVQREKRLLEFDKDNGGLTPRQQLELNELGDLEKQLLLRLK
jgi:hypothetical protein